MTKSWFHLVFVSLVILISTTVSSSQSIIETLPGYPAKLPFKLETGYIRVGEKDEIELFYYFIESESDPYKDPLLLWLSGGPGCSSFSGLVYEIGPLAFDYADSEGKFPSFTINPYSWTKLANIIFIDSPVGTGFSYSTTSEGYYSSDTKAAQDNFLFLRKWLLNHPKFINNPLYIAGDSYGGKIVPMVALEVAKGNEARLKPRMFLHGYIVGNSLTNANQDLNERVPYAHRMALVSDETFELAKSSCHGQYVNPDPNNAACIYALELINECTRGLNQAHILEPKCGGIISPEPNNSLSNKLMLEDIYQLDLIVLSKQDQLWCRNNNYAISYEWANDETVQKALQIRNGTITVWKRCNFSVAYELDIESVFKHHQLLHQRGFRALVYSGDHDFSLPYLSTLKWIRNLNLTIDEPWRPWTVDGQVAGYTVKYKNDIDYLTFATVKGAGHTAPEYMPNQCFQMIKRWLSVTPL